MATTTARNQQDVDNMSKKDRLWDSLNYSYGLKREDSDRAYDKAYSQADRQALSRGMQRSSYNAQNLANINQQKITAQNNIWDTQIADYENRLADLEQQEAEAERWERQFAANREDTAWNQAFQEKQYQAGRDDAAWNQEFQAQKYKDDRADAERNWNFTQQQYADSRADTAWQQSMTEKQYADSRADTAWNQAFQTQQYNDSRADTAWQQAFQTQQYNDSRADTAWNQAFQTQQFELQKEQWQKEFGFNEKTTDQKIAMEYAMSILQNGQMPSADLLARAGLSEADARSMMAQVSSGGNGGRSGNNGGQSASAGSANGTATGAFIALGGALQQDALASAADNYRASVKEENEGRKVSTNPSSTRTTGEYVRKKTMN